MVHYRPRVIDAELEEALKYPGAVLLEGPRACGKSATGRRHARSSIQLDIEPAALRLAELDASLLLQGEQPRFIDEWQLAPQVWNLVRASVDAAERASFILAGSAVPSDDVTRHSGAGRFLRFKMRPMALAESGQSSGQVRLRDLFSSPSTAVSGVSHLTVSALAEAAVRGGWPGLQEVPITQVRNRLRSYLDDIARVDLARLDGEPRRDPEAVLRLIRALGRSVATEVSIAALARDASVGGQLMTDSTVQAYLSALARVFVIEDQPSWGPHLRSRDRVRKAPRRHYIDPSLAAAAAGIDAQRLLVELEYFGQLFESLVVRDLRVYSEPLGGTVRHYRDSAGREADAIVELPDGSWIAVEIKLAASREDQAAASLSSFVSNLDPSRTPAPSALVIVTGGQYAYTREDGIHVVPIGALTA